MPAGASNTFQSWIDKSIQLWKNNLNRPIFASLNPVACPVIWFGDIEKDNLVMTVGANPSDKEFLPYKPGSKHPLRFLSKGSPVSVNSTPQELMEAFNDYFKNNPYTRWFGKDGGEIGVEAALRYLDASYYGKATYNAVHFDWFPFPTSVKFGKIKGTGDAQFVYNTINELGKNIIDAAIDVLKPEFILAVGKTSRDYFEKYNHLSSSKKVSTIGNKTYIEEEFCYNGVRVIWTSLYYPNPRTPKGCTSKNWAPLF